MVSLLMRSVLFLGILAIITSLVTSCKYHEELKRRQRLQEERLQLARMRYRNRHRSQTLQNSRPITSYTPNSYPIRGHTSSSNRHHYTEPNPAPYTNYNPSVHRPNGYNRRRGYYTSQNIPYNQRHVYLGHVQTEYNPERYIRCSHSSNYACPRGTTCYRHQDGVYKCRSNFQNVAREVCQSGRERVNISSTSYYCRDIDECSSPETNNCEQNCTNTPGSYECICQPGYQVLANGSCVDKDECLDRRLCQHQCVNTPGGYTCECPPGYAVHRYIFSRPKRYLCRDTDECKAGVCEEGEHCLNTFGGYECNTPESCPKGYNQSRIDPGSCFKEYTEYDSSDPVTIKRSRFALKSSTDRHRKVIQLTMNTMPGHRYSYNIVNGADMFNIYQSPRIHLTRRPRLYSINDIYTKTNLTEPGVYSVTVNVNAQKNHYPYKSTNSWVVMDFVVSKYPY